MIEHQLEIILFLGISIIGVLYVAWLLFVASETGELQTALAVGTIELINGNDSTKEDTNEI